MDYFTTFTRITDDVLQVPKGSVQLGQYYDLQGGHQMRLTPLPGSPDIEVLLVQAAMELYGSTGWVMCCSGGLCAAKESRCERIERAEDIAGMVESGRKVMELYSNVILTALSMLSLFAIQM
eukprot:1144280-Pelagomonas_calceolata.AAC.2